MKTKSDLFIDRDNYMKKLEDIDQKLGTLLESNSPNEILVNQLLKEKYVTQEILNYINSIID